MKKLLMLLLIAACPIITFAQNKPVIITTQKIPITNKKTDTKVNTQNGKVVSNSAGRDAFKPAKTVKNNQFLQKYMASLPEKTFTLPGGRKSRVSLINASKQNVIKASAGQRIKSKGRTDNCETIEVSVSAEADDFDVPYENASSYIYPGAVYLYSDYYSNNVSPKTLNWPRNPLYIQAASSSTGGEYKLVENPTRISLNNVVGSIKNSLNSNPTNLNTSIKMMSVYDESDFRFKVNAGGGGMGFRADASFGIANKANKSYFMIDVKQLMFTISAMLPESDTATVFKDMVNNQNREALMMSTVNYGRRVLGVVETEFESQEMATSFKASYSAGFAGGSIGLDMLNGMKSEKTSVKLFFVGGQANSISIPNPNSQSVMAAINNYLRSGTTQNAVPISFTFRNMAMDPMRYESATDKFTYQQCTPILPDKAYHITLNLMSIQNVTNQSEKINLGIYQDAILYVNGKESRFDGQGQKTVTMPGPPLGDGKPYTVPRPLLFWAESGNDDVKKHFVYNPIENAVSFKGTLQINKSYSTTLLQKDMMNEGSYIELNTRNITMYGFKDNHDFYDKGQYRRRIPLNKLLDGKEDLFVDVNHSQGRRFQLTFLITAGPVD